MKVVKKYSFSEFIKNSMSLIYTKIFFKKARLVRLPIYVRGNKKLLKYKKGFTIGYRSRIDIVGFKNEKNPKIEIGENCVIGDNFHIAANSKIEIGNNVLIASNVFISDLNHGIYSGGDCSSPDIPPNERKIDSKPIKIKDNVWIGEKVSILPGVTIGKGSIIGANSVVTKDIEDYSIAVGNPAKVIKRYNFESKEWEKK